MVMTVDMAVMLRKPVVAVTGPRMAALTVAEEVGRHLSRASYHMHKLSAWLPERDGLLIQSANKLL